MQDWIWLSFLMLSYKTNKKLLEKYQTPSKIQKASKEELLDLKIREETVHKILDKKNRKDVEDIIRQMEHQNIIAIQMEEDSYPKQLRNIYDSPIVLYAKGNLELLQSNMIAIVGARNCTDYGRRIAKELAEEIVKHEITIVSGLAKRN